jgi:hypothetical protein
MKLKKTKDSIKVEAPKGYHWMTESGRHFLMKGDYKPHEGASASAPFRIVTHDKTMKADMGMKIEAIKTAKKYKKGGQVKKKSKVNQAGNYTQPGMRKRLFNRIMAGSKGGNPGQWSARKAQMLAKAYKAAGGGYKN